LKLNCVDINDVKPSNQNEDSDQNIDLWISWANGTTQPLAYRVGQEAYKDINVAVNICNHYNQCDNTEIVKLCNGMGRKMIMLRTAGETDIITHIQVIDQKPLGKWLNTDAGNTYVDNNWRRDKPPARGKYVYIPFDLVPGCLLKTYTYTYTGGQ
jgi:hypothetical protein